MHNSFAAQSVRISHALLDTECDCFQMYHLFFRIKKCMSATGQASPHVSITNPPPSFLLAETHIFIENSWADFFPARSPAYFLPGFQIALSHVHCSSRLDKSHVSDMVLSVWRRNVQLHLVSCPTYSAISHFIEIISFKSSSTNIEEGHVRGPRIVKILDICIKFL